MRADPALTDVTLQLVQERIDPSADANGRSMPDRRLTPATTRRYRFRRRAIPARSGTMRVTQALDENNPLARLAHCSMPDAAPDAAPGDAGTSDATDGDGGEYAANWCCSRSRSTQQAGASLPA